MCLPNHLDVLRERAKTKPRRGRSLGVGDVAYENQGGRAGNSAPDHVRGRVTSRHGRPVRDELQDLPQTREEVEKIGKIVGPEAVILMG